MKHTILIMMFAALLAGCRGETFSQADKTFVCSAKHPYVAFRVDPGAGDTSFVQRMPDADSLCERKKEE